MCEFTTHDDWFGIYCKVSYRNYILSTNADGVKTKGGDFHSLYTMSESRIICVAISESTVFHVYSTDNNCNDDNECTADTCYPAQNTCMNEIFSCDACNKVKLSIQLTT